MSQFAIQINFHFLNKKDPAEGHFVVGEDLRRKVPLEVEGINGLNTVYMEFPESDLLRRLSIKLWEILIQLDIKMVNPTFRTSKCSIK